MRYYVKQFTENFDKKNDKIFFQFDGNDSLKNWDRRFNHIKISGPNDTKGSEKRAFDARQ